MRPNPVKPLGRSAAEWCLLAVLASAAFGLRAITVRESLWIDELHTAWCVEGPLRDVADRARAGNQPPLYFWLLWFLTRVLGISEFSLRFPSLVAGSLSCVVGAVLVRRATGAMTLGLLTGFLILIDPQAIDFAREARPYACVQFLGLLQVICFLCLRARPGVWSLAWISMSWAMFYCHYTSALLLLGEVVYLVLLWFQQPAREGRSLAVWAGLFAVCLLGMLVAWQPLMEIAARRQNWERFIPRAPWTDILRLFGGHLYVILPALGVSALAAGAYRRGVRWTVPPSVLNLLRFCVCWYVVPLVTAWVFTRQDWARLFFRRYLIAVGLVPMIVAGLLGGLLPRGKWQWSYAILVVLWITGFFAAQQPWSPSSIWRRHRNEDWRGAIQWINSDPMANRWPVYVRPGLIEDDAIRDDSDPALKDYCLFPLRALYSLREQPPAWVVLSSSRSWDWSDEQRQPLEQRSGAWLILRQSPDAAVETVSRLTKALEAAGVSVSVERQRHFGRVTVVLLRTQPNPPPAITSSSPHYPGRGAKGERSIWGTWPRINSARIWAVAGAR